MRSISLSIIVVICFLFSASIHRLLPLAFAQPAAASPNGFLSIDCGVSTSVGTYYDASSIKWTPDEEIWPELGEGWTETATVAGPEAEMGADAVKYKTLRYFPAGSQNQSKFCYPLPATGGSYYLVRATFWMGAQVLYKTRTAGIVSFVVMVDTYEVTRVRLTLPQSAVPWIEEVYVRAQEGASSIAFCLSAAIDGDDADGGSDAPFINSLELRPLPSVMTSVAIINRTNTAMRANYRSDLAASPRLPSILRYPNDTLDRSWFTAQASAGSRIETSESVSINGLHDFPPAVALQTAAVLNSHVTYGYYNLSIPAGTAFRYYVAIWFAEVDPRVNASGQRVFDVFINNDTVTDIDVFAAVGAFSGYEIYAGPDPLGPYSDYILLLFSANATSLYPPIVSAIEILQLLEDPMATRTASSDVLAVQDLAGIFVNSSSFFGDPCFPVNYRNSWINCTAVNQNSPRVTSISLSNYNTSPGKTIPSSLNKLDLVTHISLSGNALEGSLPDLSNLVFLQVLDLSNNKLRGPIPESLGNLPRLTFLDLRNNNFSGVVPISLQQKKGLTLRYDGNSFLCLTNNATCGSSTPQTTTKGYTPLIVGIVVGVLVFVILLSVIILCICKRKRHGLASAEQPMNPIAANKNKVDPHALGHTQVIEVANVARAFSFQEVILATNNFSTILGRGGFGYVYRGTLPNGLDVAIKVLSDASQQGEQEFLNEVALLSRARHKNLVGLVGYSIEERLVLIYEYMPNGSLFDNIFGHTRTNPLIWMERLRILLDAAQGLAYLHHDCNPSIIHRDVKSSNILLTEHLESKMCDFGISRLKAIDGDAQTTRILGSLGYLDPQYASTTILSEKIDVYGFGVVIFETLCGRPPLTKDPNNEFRDIHIVEWVRQFYDKGAIEEVVDYNLGRYNKASVWKAAEVAMACVQPHGESRPTMNDVCSELYEALRLEANSHEISPMSTGEFFPSVDVQAR